MYTLFIGNKNYSSWSLRPWALMTELAIPFEERLMRFAEGGSRAAFRAFSPSGTVPCLHDGGTVVWESLAIVEYLAERHAGVWPEDAAARAWARCAAAEMHAGFGTLRERCTMNVGVRVRLADISGALGEDISRLSVLFGEGLRRFGGPFLTGEAFGAVDAFFTPVAFRVRTYGLRLEGAASGYVERLLGLRSVKAWEAAALAEDFREPGHEEEMRRAGALVEDLRAR